MSLSTDSSSSNESLPSPKHTKSYRRIQRSTSSESENEKPTTSSGASKATTKDNVANNSEKTQQQYDESDDDEYVPLGGSTSSSSGSENNSDSEPKSHSSWEQDTKNLTRKGVRRKLTSSYDEKKSATRKNKRRKLSPSPKKKNPGKSKTSRSMEDFIVSSEDAPESDSLSSSESNSPRTRRKSSRKSAARSARSRSRSSESTESESDNLFEKITSVKNNRRKTRSQAAGGDGHIPYDVYTSIKSLVPGASPSQVRRRKSKRKVKLEQPRNIVTVKKKKEHSAQSDSSAEDFIDDDTENFGNLESSSSSDNDVVPEDKANLDLNSDNYEYCSSSDNSNKSNKQSDKSSDSESDKSQTSSSSNISYVKSESSALKSQKQKCAVCRALEGLDLKGRDRKLDDDNRPDWCCCKKCWVFSPLMKNYDRICCNEINSIVTMLRGEYRCITSHPHFKDTLVSISARKSGKQMDWARQAFVRWVFGNIDGNSMVLPACVLQKLREKFMKSAGRLSFENFRPKEICDYGFHCKKAKLGI